MLDRLICSETSVLPKKNKEHPLNFNISDKKIHDFYSTNKICKIIQKG